MPFWEQSGDSNPQDTKPFHQQQFLCSLGMKDYKLNLRTWILMTYGPWWPKSDFNELDMKGIR